jgi:hypothetical protein
MEEKSKQTPPELETAAAMRVTELQRADPGAVQPVAAAAPPVGETATEAASEPGAQTITLEELERLRRLDERVILLDVRTERSLETSESMAQGAVRMPPDHVVEQARELRLPKEAWLIAYCA